MVKNIFYKLSKLLCKIAEKIKRKFASKAEKRSEFGKNNLEKISLEDGEVVRASKNKAIKKENSSFVNNLIKNDVAVKNALRMLQRTKYALLRRKLIHLNWQMQYTQRVVCYLLK